MKITDAQYKELKNSIDVIAKYAKLSRSADIPVHILWCLLHEVNAQKSYGADHPRWLNVPHLLPQTHIHSSSTYLGELYNSGLNDSHIETALKQIAKDWGKEVESSGS